MTQARSRRWLLANDGSLNANRAADYVARWARPFGVSDVYLLNAQPVGSYRAYAMNRNAILLEANERGADATARARRALDDAAIHYRFHVQLSDPADAILRSADSEHAEEIIMGTRGMSALANLALGSIAYKVLHLARVPVTVVSNPLSEAHLAGPDAPSEHRVLLAVDGSEHSARAVEYVCRFAHEGIPIEATLVNVQLPIMSGDGRRAISEEAIDTHYREQGESALRAAKNSLQRVGIRSEAHVMVGHLAQTIVRLAERDRCARVVMGTRGLSATANLVVGSTAYKVLHSAPTPVTLVK